MVSRYGGKFESKRGKFLFNCNLRQKVLAKVLRLMLY